MKPITHQAESTLEVYQNGSYTTCTNSSGATPMTMATDTAILAVTSMAWARRRQCRLGLKAPRSVSADALAVDAAEVMEQQRVTSVLAVDDHGRMVGALNTNDLMRAKVI